MKFVFLSLATLISTVCFAGTVEYNGISALKHGNLSLRDTWDTTGQFCYKTKTEDRTCLDISDMGEVKIKDYGQWSSEPESLEYTNNLTFDDVETAQGYDKIFVRYLALDGSSKFVVHVFFLGAGTPPAYSQTIFALGEHGPNSSPKITQMSYSSGLEELGATLLAASNLKNGYSKDNLKAQIVKDRKPLLNLVQSVVETYLGKTHLNGPRQNLD